MSQGTKCPRNISFKKKKTLGKMPTKKKGLLKIAFAKYTFKTWKKSPGENCFKKMPFLMNSHSKKKRQNKNLLQKMLSRKKPTGQMPPRKKPRKKNSYI